MISFDLFDKTEPKMLHLINLWNTAEGNPLIYKDMFRSNPHELAGLIKQGTSFNDWQMFLTDSRVQDYIDRNLYVQAGITVSYYLKEGTHMTQADSAKLKAAIDYRDNHKPDFAIPVQYIYIQTPLTKDEKEFLPDVPENKPIKGVF